MGRELDDRLRKAMIGYPGIGSAPDVHSLNDIILFKVRHGLGPQHMS
jgi:hypothetical protein